MWVGLFLNSTTPIQLAVTTETVEDLAGAGAETIYHLGEKHRPGTVTVDHQLMMTSLHRDVRYQVLQNLSWILGAPPAVLTKIPVNDRWGDSARTLLSSGCHVTELREGAWTLAQNFGRTVGGF